jgi:hypothetical protein
MKLAMSPSVVFRFSGELVTMGPLSHYQAAINQQASAMDRGGCAPVRSEHSVITRFG